MKEIYEYLEELQPMYASGDFETMTVYDEDEVKQLLSMVMKDHDEVVFGYEQQICDMRDEAYEAEQAYQELYSRYTQLQDDTLHEHYRD